MSEARQSRHNVCVVVPTLNAAAGWSSWAAAVNSQTVAFDVLVVDSSSDDDTAKLAQAAGFEVIQVPRESFSHGGTRQLAAESRPDAEILVYLTQDAVLASPESISRLLHPFTDPKVAACFGRQLPRLGADPLEAHARLYNYPGSSYFRNFESRHQQGLKTIFFSNSFAAYRRDALLSVGGFRSDLILGEDTVAVAYLLMEGWTTAYVGEAEVYHSHPYSTVQEFKRYFDVGVLHSQIPHVLDRFGYATGEGFKYLRSEIAYLARTSAIHIPASLVRCGFKLCGYSLGRHSHLIAPALKRYLSMHSGFWSRTATWSQVSAGQEPNRAQ